MYSDVIFLDIDGVLIPDSHSYTSVFAPQCVSQLDRVLRETAQTFIVLSTSWRNDLPLFALGWHWRSHGLPLNRVIGRTPEIHIERRGEEIIQWLNDAPRLAVGHSIRRFAVVDDQPELIHQSIPEKNVFVCDSAQGLTCELADRLISFLKS